MQTDQLEQLRNLGLITYEHKFTGGWARARERHTTAIRLLEEWTMFLPDGTTAAARLYCLRNDILSSPVCGNCGCSTAHKFNSTKGFAQYCSPKCSNTSTIKKDTIVVTNQEKYGGHPRSTVEVQDKAKSTNIERYGVDNPAKSSKVRQKTIATNLERYGVESTSLVTKFQEKRMRTNIERYGVQYIFQSEDKQHQAQQTVLQRYGVTSTAKLPEVKSKAATHHECRYVSAEAYVLINDPAWLREQHIVQKKTLTEIAASLGLRDEKSVSKKLHKFGIPITYHVVRSSVAEQQIAAFVSQFAPIVANDRTTIAPKELDIWIPQHNLAIEYCGLYWHGDKVSPEDAIRRHSDKLRMCTDSGIRLITIFEDEWKNRRPAVESKIRRALGLTTGAVYARKCNIVQLSPAEREEFLTMNHIQGDFSSNIAFGLAHQNTLVACLVMTRSEGDDFTIARYATSTNVVGGYSKLLRHFCSQNAWTSITTFADLRWDTGATYITLGFTYVATIPPDYSWTDGYSRHHKFAFRRKLLAKKFANYDQSLTEDQNCRANGFWKIWDAGKVKFILRNPNVLENAKNTGN